MVLVSGFSSRSRKSPAQTQPEELPLRKRTQTTGRETGQRGAHQNRFRKPDELPAWLFVLQSAPTATMESQGHDRNAKTAPAPPQRSQIPRHTTNTQPGVLQFLSPRGLPTRRRDILPMLPDNFHTS